MPTETGMGFFWPLLLTVLDIGLLTLAARRTGWRQLHDPAQLNILLAAIVLTLVIWRIRVPLGPGLDLHLLGSSLLALMFDWPLAVLSMAVVIMGELLQGRQSLPLAGVEHLLLGALPALFSAWIQAVVKARLPRNLFVYFFVTAYLGTAVAAAGTVLARSLVHQLLGLRPEHLLPGDYLAFQLLLAFPEAFLTGMLATIFIIYRPGWMPAFDRRHYRLPY